MKKIFLIVCVCVGLTSSAAFAAAIPTKEECKAAREKLSELTNDDYKALKAKTKTNEQVGDALAQYADNEESAAGRFALLQDAFLQYVLGKNVDKAESVYSKAQTIGGVEYALEMARPSRYKLSAYATSKNPQAKALKERIVEDEKSFQRVGIVKAKLKKAPGDESLCEQLGIEYAAIGDWESALAAFVTAAGEVAKVADWELGGGKGVDYTAATVGAFWWKFADNFPKRKNVEEAMKLHAAMWYKVALDKDIFRGNERTIIEKRIAQYSPDITETVNVKEPQQEELLKRSDTCVKITPTLIWKNVHLDSITTYTARLIGRAIGEMPKEAEGCNVKTDGNVRSVQFQIEHGGFIKCVSVQLVQQGDDVYGMARYARYKRNGCVGIDFDIEKCEKQTIAELKDAAGYGVMDLSFVRGLSRRKATKPTDRRTVVFDRYIMLKPTLIWKDVHLNDIDEISGFMTGACPKNLAKGYNINRSTSGVTLQFQTYDGPWIKCVGVKFFQRGKDVFGNVCYSAYLSRDGVQLGVNFDKCTVHNNQPVEKDGDTKGYGIKGAMAIVRSGSR